MENLRKSMSKHRHDHGDIPFKTLYHNYEVVQTDCSGPSMTKQAFKDEVDINWIMRKYEKTGLIEHVNRFQGKYADLGSAEDFHSCMNRIAAADEAFMTLPASIRERFSNSPEEFLRFVNDENNIDEMRKLGLLDGVDLNVRSDQSEVGIMPEVPNNGE